MRILFAIFVLAAGCAKAPQTASRPQLRSLPQAVWAVPVIDSLPRVLR